MAGQAGERNAQGGGETQWRWAGELTQKSSDEGRWVAERCLRTKWRRELWS